MCTYGTIRVLLGYSSHDIDGIEHLFLLYLCDLLESGFKCFDPLFIRGKWYNVTVVCRTRRLDS